MFYCTLKRNHIILYHIWYLLHDEQYYIYSRILQHWFQHAVINFQDVNLSIFYNIIKWFCIIFDATWWTYRSIYIPEYPALISTCCNQFNHYKTWISIRVFYNTHKLNHISVSYLISATWWNYRSIPEYLFHLITTTWILSTTLSSIIASFYCSILQHSQA